MCFKEGFKKFNRKSINDVFVNWLESIYEGATVFLAFLENSLNFSFNLDKRGSFVIFRVIGNWSNLKIKIGERIEKLRRVLNDNFIKTCNFVKI